MLKQSWILLMQYFTISIKAFALFARRLSYTFSFFSQYLGILDYWSERTRHLSMSTWAVECCSSNMPIVSTKVCSRFVWRLVVLSFFSINCLEKMTKLVQRGSSVLRQQDMTVWSKATWELSRLKAQGYNRVTEELVPNNFTRTVPH